MSCIKKLNKAKVRVNTGFGTNNPGYGGLFLKKVGNRNIEKRGSGYFERLTWDHAALQVPRWKYLLLSLTIYMLLNLFFVGIYYAIGIEKPEGMALKFSFANG